MKIVLQLVSASIVCGLVAFATFPAQGNTSEAEQEFIQHMLERHQIPRAETEAILRAANKSQPILDAISRPWEARPWYEYYTIFLTDRRLQEGLAFWDEHADTLTRARRIYGVPEEITVAILGVETYYGGVMGRHRVLDALYTLGFHFPPRQTFFRSELAQFMLLVREENLPAEELMGSYAGAMGYGQFISSSYRHYAVDFDGDGQRDLFTNVVDAIGSIANYFARHHWRDAQPIAVPAWVSPHTDIAALTAGRGTALTHTVEQLQEQGVHFITALPPESRARLFAFSEGDGNYSYWVGFHNFYAITRYNHSPLYAMAVFQLAEQLRAHRAMQDAR